MAKATSSFATERASQYLQTMLKHFSHRVEVEYDASQGRAAMPHGSLRMRAHDGALHFEVEAANAESLEQLKSVVDAHIVRFAFREKLERLEWR